MSFLTDRFNALRERIKGFAPVPMPGRGNLGVYPDWRQMLASWFSQVQTVNPADANDGKDNSIVAILLNWITTSWMVAPPQVGKLDESGNLVETEGHPLPALLANPNANMDGAALLSALVTDWVRKGNSYAYIGQSRGGAPVSLTYLPAKSVAPIPDEMGNLLRYDYTVNSKRIPLKPEEVLHFRNGVDEDFPLQGVSPLAAQYREIITDNKYSDTSASIAMNGGVNPGVFTPRLTPDGMMGMTAEEATQLSDAYHERRTKFPGRIPFIPGSLEYHKIGLTVQELDLSTVRAMPETRIPAALGIPAILLQLYTGIQKSTYNNLAEAIQQGWRGGIIPMMRVFEAQINKKLLPLYPNSKGLVFKWDTSVVPELQDDTIALREADRADVVAGILTVDEARERQGLSAMPESEKPQAQPQDAATVGKKLSELEARLRIVGTQEALKQLDSLRPVLKVAGGAGADIYAVADAYRRALARNEIATLDDLAMEWARAERSLQSRINSLTDFIRSEVAAGRDVAQWQGEALSRLNALQSQIEGELTDLSDRGAAIVESGQRAAILTTTKYAQPLAQAAAGIPPQGVSLAWNALAADAFEALVGMASDGSPLSSLLDTFGVETAANIRQALLDGIIAGDNPRAVAQRLSVASSVGRARLENIARTEMLRASREACRRTYAANSDVVAGYRRLSAADARTCVACWGLHGTFSETGQIMPTHPQCRCVAVPELRSWAEITGDMSLPTEREPMASGEELFSLLPESAQLEILGPGRLELYRNGAPLSSLSETTNDAQWGPGTRIKPLAEVTN